MGWSPCLTDDLTLQPKLDYSPMTIELIENQCVKSAEKTTKATIPIGIIHDRHQEFAEALRLTLSTEYFEVHVDQIDQCGALLERTYLPIVISFLTDQHHIHDVTKRCLLKEDSLHIAVTDSAHATLLNKAVDDRQLYKFLTFPVTATAMHAHILEALQALRLRQERQALLNEISSINKELGSLDQHVKSIRKGNTSGLLNNPQIDPLTNLPNRYMIFDRIKQAINLAERNRCQCAVLSLDLDRFSVINQTFGLRFGNQLLREFSQRLVSCMRRSDSVAREGNDEFLLVINEIESHEAIAHVIKRLQHALSTPFIVDSQEIFLTLSIGVSVYPHDEDDPESLLRAANTAMKHAKQLGGNGYQYFESEMNVRLRKLVDMESNLFRALEKNEFVIYYQPQVSLRTGKIVGAEALLRWRRPEHGIIPPNEFIPILEETGLIEQVGEWILYHVSEQNEKWLAQGLPEMRVSINLSLRQLQDSSILNIMAKLVSELGSTERARSIELEITESIMMKDAQKVISLLIELRNMGINLAIDDFGTGYASLSYLTRFPVHSLKIDLSFIQRIESSNKDAAIVRAIIAMAQGLGLRVTAEGVETRQQLDFLIDCGCDEMQGYYYSKPLPAEEFEQLLLANTPLPV